MLANDSITIAGNATALGGSITAATILNGTSVISSSAQIGNYVATLGTGTGVTIGSNTGDRFYSNNSSRLWFNC